MTIAPDRPATTKRTVTPRVNDHLDGVRHFVPKASGKPDPVAHLSPAQIEEFGRKMDELRDEVMASRGERDAKYIRRVIAWQRGLEIGSRTLLLFSHYKPAWVIGTAALSVAKIVDNMEVGHNIIHGQWDWMRDPKINSRTWEWDNATPSDLWKHSHNELHHTYTNVIGKDNDLGYGLFRTDEDQRWHPFYLGQPLWNFVNAVVFQYSIAAYDLEIGRVLKGKADMNVFREKRAKVLKKVGKQTFKDYVAHPLLAGPNAGHVITANLTADLVRNLWTHGVIMCGHFPKGIETFAKKSIEGETRGEWYIRQALGSGNISGGKVIHFMSGNLSHQIEHHLFPDMPSNRYVEVAPRVRAIMKEYGLPYVTGPMHRQLASCWSQTFRYALPNGAWDELRKNPVRSVKKAIAWLRK